MSTSPTSRSACCIKFAHGDQEGECRLYVCTCLADPSLILSRLRAMDEGSVLSSNPSRSSKTLFFGFHHFANCDSPVLPKGPDRGFLLDLECQIQEEEGGVDRSVREKCEPRCLLFSCRLRLGSFFYFRK